MYIIYVIVYIKKYFLLSLFVWLMADSWCWFILREKYCWLDAGGWFVLREKYCWLVVDKPNEQAVVIYSYIHELETDKNINFMLFIP
jgi:hypothetical protein